MKRIPGIAILLLLTVISFASANPPRESYRIRTVVIDPGHGGHDAGCLGSSAREKHVALEISLKLGKLIEQTYPDVKVIFTRKTDVFIPLHERANIANRNHADLFICVHLNSGNKAAYGAETYVMGLHKSEDNLNVAKRENASILLEDDYKTQYDGFDPNSPEANIIFSLYQNQFMHQSLSFASKIQDQFEEYAGRNNRGVKQAGFLVLYKTAMPAVLIESGFLTHDMEEKYLDSEKGQTTIATSIFRAFKEYKIDMETPGSGANKEANNQSVEPDNTTVKKDPQINQEEEKKPAINAQVEERKSEKPAPVVEKTPVKETKQPETKPVVVKETKQPETKTSVVKESKAADTTKTTEENPKPKLYEAPPSKAEAPVKSEISISIYFTVQIGASTNPQKDSLKYAKTTGSKGIKCADGYTRYVVGSFNTIEAARQRQAQLKSAGYKDAFITAFKGNERLTVTEAEQMLKTP